MQVADSELRETKNVMPTLGYVCRRTEGYSNVEDVLDGSFTLTRTVSDLLFHASDCTELVESRTFIERPPGVTLGVLLSGTVEFAFGKERHVIEATSDTGPVCFAFNLSTNTLWERKTNAGNRVVKVLASIPHAWFTDRYARAKDFGLLVQGLMRTHKKVWSFPASEKIKCICKTAVESGETELLDLEVESIALSFIAALLQHHPLARQECANPEEENTSVSSSAYEICAYLEKNIIGGARPVPVDLTLLAEELGYSVSAAQKLFKNAYGKTIIEYVRYRRLQIAREQLLNSVSIGEVSYLAGYKHISNFTAAFKKVYKVSPGSLQTK